MKLQSHGICKDVQALLLAVKRCMDDPEKDPRVKQHVEQGEGIEAGLKTIVEGFTRSATDLGNQFEKAKSTDEAQAVLAKLKDAKAEAKAKLAAKKKVLGALWTMLQKQEKQTVGDAGLAEDTGDHFETAGADAALFNYIQDHLCVQLGTQQNIVSVEKSSDLAALAAKPMGVVDNEARAKAIAESKVLTAIQTWLRGQLAADKDNVSAMLDQKKHIGVVEGFVTGCLQWKKEGVFTVPYSVVHAEVVGNVFGISMDHMRAGYQVRGFRPNGLGQWLMPVKGVVILWGIASENVEGLSYAQKITAIGEMKSDDFAKFVQQGKAFYMRLAPRSLLWTPPGYLVSIRAMHDACVLKWSSLDIGSRAALVAQAAAPSQAPFAPDMFVACRTRSVGARGQGQHGWRALHW